MTERDLREITTEMVPWDWMGIRNAWMKEPSRMSYAWQVPEFDPKEHVVIRYWCRRNNVDIVDFWRGFYPSMEGDLPIVETTNPEIIDELKEGSYSPTRGASRSRTSTSCATTIWAPTSPRRIPEYPALLQDLRSLAPSTTAMRPSRSRWSGTFTREPALTALTR